MRTGVAFLALALIAAAAVGEPERRPARDGAAGEGEPLPAASEAVYGSPWWVAPSDFEPTDPTDQCLQDGDALGGAYLSGNGGFDCCAVAPVYLPDGATLTLLAFRLYDAGAGNFSYQLVRNRLDTLGAYDVMAVVSTSGSDTTVRLFTTVDIDFPVVDTAQYSYFLAPFDTCLGPASATRFYAAQVFFSE